MISPAAVLFGLAVASPAVWAALMQGTVPVDVALGRVVVILAVATIGWSALQRLISTFALSAERATGQPEGEGPSQMRAVGGPRGRRATDG